MEHHDSRSNRQPGRWSSGRLLSETARQKKRENDRRSKANARKRDREHTLELEARVEELSAMSEEQRLQIDALRHRIDALEGSNGRYRKELETYVGTPPGHGTHRQQLQTQEPVSYANVLSNQANLSDWRNQVSSFADANSIAMPRGILPSNAGSSHWPGSQHHMVSQVYSLDVNHNSYVQTPSGTVALPNQHQGEPHHDMTAGLENISETLAACVARVRELDPEDVSFEDDYNQDAIIRIAVWSQLENNDCPILDLIARGERTFARYTSTNLMEKLALIRQMHRLMLYDVCQQERDISGLPDWYKPTKLQRRKKHDSLIDYLPWPDFRDRLVLGLKSPRLDARFWLNFGSSLQLAVDISTPTTCFQATSDGRYGFTQSFENVIKDLNNWRMKPEFFEEYPELYAEFPSNASYRPGEGGRGVVDSLNHHATTAGSQNNSNIDRNTMGANTWPT